MNTQIESLKQSVINNCHISDAQYAGNYTLCIYLLKMREFYRWENHIPFGTKLLNESISDWLAQRESEWDELENDSFSQIPCKEKEYSCFDVQSVNSAINKDNLIYSAGYGNYNKPIFFLADLDSETKLDNYQLFICGQEYARELAAPPGMSQDNVIFIRKESLKRFIWEKYEESHWYNKENPLARALACYDFEHKPDSSVEQMAVLEANTVLYHEMGEILSTRLLGHEWSDMVMNIPRSKTEFIVRAVKDHIADAISTLPRLIENRDEAQIHFYFANLTGMRKELFPSLMQAYQHWLKQQDFSALNQLTEQAEKHWLKLAKKLVDLYSDKGAGAFSEFDTIGQKNIL